MEQNILTASTGREHGSGPSRRLRAEDKVPAVVYGAGDDPVSVTVDRLEFRRVLNAAGANAVITLSIDGTDQLTFVRDVQIHPIKDRVQHIDFLRVDAKQRVSAEVPVVLVGEAVELGRQGGIVEQLMGTLVIEAGVTNIPRVIEVDITPLTLENSIRIADLDLGEGVTSELDEESPVVSGSLSRAAVADEGTDEAEGEGEGDAAEESED